MRDDGARGKEEWTVEITEAKVKLVSDKTDKLKAYCTITIDGEFVIRDIKVIKGTGGHFVAMPSRKLMDRCPSCGGKNHLRAAYCNDCGASLRGDRVPHDPEGRAKLHADIAHPINSACRERLQARILEAYERETQESRTVGHVAAREEETETEDLELDEEAVEAVEAEEVPQSPAEPVLPRVAPPPPEPKPPAEGRPPPPRQEDETDDFASGIF